MIDARVKTAILASKQQAKRRGVPQEKSKTVFSLKDTADRAWQKKIKIKNKESVGGRKNGKGRRKLQNALFCSPAVYTEPQRL